MERVLPLLVPVVLLVASLRLLLDAWRSIEPARLLLAGRYADARAAAERVERTWMRKVPSSHLAAQYTIACALHLEGDLERALEVASRLDHDLLRGNIRYAVLSIEAASLVLLGRDPERALALLAEASTIQQPPEDRLLAAHATLDAGDHERAAKLFEDAGSERSGRSARIGAVTLLEASDQKEAIFHYLRGWYFTKTRQHEEARSDLVRAASSEVTTVYVVRARQLLDSDGSSPALDEDDDPRSSLAGVALARTRSRPDS